MTACEDFDLKAKLFYKTMLPNPLTFVSRSMSFVLEKTVKGFISGLFFMLTGPMNKLCCARVGR